MSRHEDPHDLIEQYLNRVRQHLKPLQPAGIPDLLQELRSHILERAQADGELSVAGVNHALELLGRAEDVAAQYVMEHVLTLAGNSRSPWRVIRGVFHWATTSIAGFAVLIVSMLSYLISVPFLIMAVAKLIVPAHVGFWIQTATEPHTLDFGIQTHIPMGHEILGWWIVPIGLIVGVGLSIATLQFDLWCIRVYKQTMARTRFRDLFSH